MVRVRVRVRLGEGLGLVVPVGGQHEGIAGLDLYREDARFSVEGVPPG